jgi:hypothetical protein
LKEARVMQHLSARTEKSKSDAGIERKDEEKGELYVCKKCGAIFKQLFELIQDEMEHVTPEFES